MLPFPIGPILKIILVLRSWQSCYIHSCGPSHVAELTYCRVPPTIGLQDTTEVCTQEKGEEGGEGETDKFKKVLREGPN